MRIVPGHAVEIEYMSTVYQFLIENVEPSSSGFFVDIHVPERFRDDFKRNENLARWSGRRFQKFFISKIREVADD